MKNDISERIIKYMRTLEWPSTTEDIAKAVNISWNTAQVHLLKLQAEGKVKFRKVGRQNQWWLNKAYNESFH